MALHACEIIFGILYLTTRSIGADVFFEITPTTIHPPVTSSLTLTCSLADLSTPTIATPLTSDMTTPYSIAITRDARDIATVSQQLQATFFGNNSASANVTGQISSKTGFLKLVYRNPSTQLSGKYECFVTGVDQHGHGHVITKSQDVVAGEVTFNDLVSEIQSLKVQREKSEAVNLEQRKDLNRTNQLVEKLITLTANQSQIINAISQTNNVLKTSVSALTQKLDKIESKQNTAIYFTAGLSKSVNITANSTVVFDDVEESVGGGYNAKTGEFICPAGGFYLFHIHVLSQEDGLVQLYLARNQYYVFYVFLQDKLDYNAASNTAVVQLYQGDVVKVVTSRNSSLYGNGYRHSSFTGVLLSLF